MREGLAAAVFNHAPADREILALQHQCLVRPSAENHAIRMLRQWLGILEQILLGPEGNPDTICQNQAAGIAGVCPGILDLRQGGLGVMHTGQSGSNGTRGTVAITGGSQ